MLMAVVAGVFSLNASAEGITPLPVLKKATKGEQCVEPVGKMRRHHMELLKHQREDTMRRGIRPERRNSLKGCIECHVQKDGAGNFIPVNNPEQFCRSCHEYAAVTTLDCFGCHATKPAEK
ncbi:MAG: Hdr-like menaquinol oxidoreductase cytochrome c subunit [Gammaproteobacteria bacterium]|nr:Hdr-like menaquinol oxidoreductase cytochrome c subunit [Gammaproteobacteria bacterium]